MVTVPAFVWRGGFFLRALVIDYNNGIHTAAEKARLFRWLPVLILVVATGTAVWDAVYGSWGNAAASGIYLVLLLLELFWWPKRLERLLTNADRAADIAGQILQKQVSG